MTTMNGEPSERITSKAKSSSSRHSILSKRISKDFLAAASKFTEVPETENGADNSSTSGKVPPASSRKSTSALRSMFMLIPAGTGNFTRKEDAPPVPKKLKLDQDKSEEVAESEREPHHDNDKEIPQKRRRQSLTAQVFRGSSKLATGSPSVKKSQTDDDDASQTSRLMRHASSSGTSSEYSLASGGGGGSVGGISMTRLAKTDIKFVEMKNKLNDSTNQLSAANKRCDELEREVERLNKENQTLRRKLEAALANNNSTASTNNNNTAGSNNKPEVPDDAESFLIKLENLDKSITSRVLLQMAESFGGEVTTVRIMKAPTGSLHGYCSFANEKDALKAADMWKKMGLSAIPIGANPSASSSSALSNSALGTDDLLIKSGSKPSHSTSSTSSSGLRRWKN